MALNKLYKEVVRKLDMATHYKNMVENRLLKIKIEKDFLKEAVESLEGETVQLLVLKLGKKSEAEEVFALNQARIPVLKMRVLSLLLDERSAQGLLIKHSASVQSLTAQVAALEPFSDEHKVVTDVSEEEASETFKEVQL